MTIDEKIAVMTAFRDGKQIEFLSINGWKEIDTPSWNFLNHEYRIKPSEKLFDLNFENTEILLGKIVRYKRSSYTIICVSGFSFSTKYHDFSLSSMDPDLEIKTDNKWILFKDYKPETL